MTLPETCPACGGVVVGWDDESPGKCTGFCKALIKHLPEPPLTLVPGGDRLTDRT